MDYYARPCLWYHVMQSCCLIMEREKAQHPAGFEPTTFQLNLSLRTHQVYLTGVVSLLARSMRIDVANFFGFEVPAETGDIRRKIDSGIENLDKEDACLYVNKGAIHEVKTRYFNYKY